MRVVLWQGPSPGGDVAGAEAALVQALRAAGAVGADVLVAPELWFPGYNVAQIEGIGADAPMFDRLQGEAERAGCALVLGFAEAGKHVLYNSALCLHPDGRRDLYRKIQLYGPREAALFEAGDHYVTFALGKVKAALLICYDVEFAPHIAALAAQGVELILAPTANMLPFEHVARATVPAMAANHGVSIVYANFCGTEGALTYAGGSLIVGPHGEVLARAGAHPALLVADLPARDPARLSTQARDYRAV